MEQARWREVETVFQAAQERSAEERSAFLDQACGGDVELRQEVESLLRAATDTRFLEPSSAADLDLAPAGALFLNDFDFAPDGSSYASDMRLRTGPDGKAAPVGPGRIYRIDADRHARIALESPALVFPEGIGWDARGRPVISAPFQGHAVQAWRPGVARPAVHRGRSRPRTSGSQTPSMCGPADARSGR